MALTMKNLGHGLFLVAADCPKRLARTFIRFQEHYESPEFKGKVFTLEEFKGWYQPRFGVYEETWAGFNVPDRVLQPFRQGNFNPLSEDELWLLRTSGMMNDGKPYYVIGAQDGDVLTIQHEVAHGLYYLNSLYKKSVDEIVLSSQDPNVTSITSHLIDHGYDPSVITDEIHAYLLFDTDDLIHEGAMQSGGMAAEIELLQQNFHSHFDSSILNR